ncbi:MAG: hypothetical protein JSS72_01880 [Armatimonadetes bacterium]|nr:hypothetical protein [Armatimonadota bacterium]
MGFLSSASLRRVALLRARLFRTPVTVLRCSVSSNGAGGSSETWVDVLTTYGQLRKPRRMSYLSIQGEQWQAFSTWDVLLDPGLDVRPHDRLSMAGLTLHVLGVDAGRADPLCLVVQCQSVN